MARVKSAKGGQSPRVVVAAGSESVKLKLTVDRETARLLRLEAFGRDVSLGQVVRDLLRASPRRFVLVDRGGRGAQGVEGASGSAESSVLGDRGAGPSLGVVSEAG